MADNIDYSIIARDKASGTLSKIGKNAKQSETSMTKFGSSAKKALGAVLAFETAKTVTKGLIGMAKAAAEDQTSMALLAKQFKNSAHATQAQINSTENWITAVGRARGVADDELRPALGQLVTATHSVRKAQELTNLAMNIAAAKGKPLAAVSLALSKAYNGNVGALGRLGIKTKDAKGKTLSFTEAQKELNRQFGGAAAAKAKTFTGVLDRFHVAVQEGGEAIGYKLLPQLTKFVPKITDFVNGMQDGTGAGGHFVDEVKSDVLPVVKNLGAEAKVLVTAIKPLGSVLASLPPGLVATGGAASILGTKLGSMRPPLAEGATGFAKLGRAASSAAGGAGLLGLTDAANRTNPALAGLEGGLSGAVTAFAATGNPIAALIGAAGGGLLGIFSSANKAADGIEATTKAALLSRDAIDQYKASLEGLSAVATSQTRKDILGNIDKARGKQKNGDPGILAGIQASDKTILNAVLGRRDAYVTLFKEIEAPLSAAQGAVSKQSELVDSLKQRIKDSGGLDVGAQSELVKQQNILDTLVKRRNVAQSLESQQTKFLSDLQTAQREERKRNAEALTFNQLLKKGVPKPVAHFIDKNGVQQDVRQVADLIGRFKIVDQTKWKAILSAEGLKPSRDMLKQIEALLKDASRARTARLTLKIAGDVGLATALGAFNGNTRMAGRKSETQQWYDTFVKSVAKGTPKLQTALDRAKSGVDALQGSLSNLRDTRAGFTSTFSADSIFGADLETTGSSLTGLLQFQSKQAQNAQQLLADVRAVTSKGLSKGLVSQLQAAGSSGAAQLHLLAGANASQIAQFNSTDVATSGALASAGLLAGNYYNGGKPGMGNIDATIAIRTAELRMAQALEKALAGHLGGKTEVHIHLEGKDIVYAYNKYNHNKGKPQRLG